MKLTKNQKGFSIIEILLLIIALGLIVFVIFYVYSFNKDDSASSQQQATSSQADTDKAETVDPTADWQKYTDRAGHFSLKYPLDWVIADNLDSCSETLVLLGADASSVGKCATEAFGQISVQSIEGNQLSNVELDAEHYPDLATKTIEADGVEGKRQTGSYKKLASDDDFGFGPAEGDKLTRYTFYTNGRTFMASYSEPVAASYPDAIEEFDLMVTKTLKFL